MIEGKTAERAPHHKALQNEIKSLQIALDCLEVLKDEIAIDKREKNKVADQNPETMSLANTLEHGHELIRTCTERLDKLTREIRGLLF